MKIDLTLKVMPQMIKDADGGEKRVLSGHIGTHFDVMDKEFPLEYTELKGVVFDVSNIWERDITIQDINFDMVEPDMFVAFYTGFIEAEGYGGEKYFAEHPQLDNELIDRLIEKKVAIIGLDFAGVRRGAEHPPIDRHCANNNVFIVENLCNLGDILRSERQAVFTASTYPVNFAGITGLPCRVVAHV